MNTLQVNVFHHVYCYRCIYFLKIIVHCQQLCVFSSNAQFQKISILTPREGIGISWEVGGSVRSKNLKKCIKLNWNFQRDEVVLEKIPSVGEVWIFSEITQNISGTKNEV